MSTVPAATVAMVVLAAGGLMPAVALAGPRMRTLPLVPLTGAVVAAFAATCYMAVGGSFLGWFIGLAVASALAVAVMWWRRPDRFPRKDASSQPALGDLWPRVIGIVGALAIVCGCVWCLRGLATPTVGFDARAVWLMRAGWFLQSHQQLLIKMRVPDLILNQSAYPPLVSAATAVAWRVTGDQTARLGVVVIALLNTCALITAASALVEAGSRASARLVSGQDQGGERPFCLARGEDRPQWVSLTPMLVGTAAAVLLVFVAFGITEPFITNGYADPIWSLAAVGAVAYGLQIQSSRENWGAAMIFLLVAGTSKDEGVVVAGLLILLITVRRLAPISKQEPRLRWRQPLLWGLSGLVAIGLWPVVMRLIHARGESSGLSSPHDLAARMRASYDGMAPYLHVIVIAAPLAVVGGLVLSRVRRRSGLANDWWAWGGLACGLLAVGGAFVTGTAAIKPWLETTVHRVTEFSSLTGWWIVATWAVVGSGALLATRQRGPISSPGERTEEDADPVPLVDRASFAVTTAPE